MKYLFALIFSIIFINTIAQQTDITSLQETAKNFVKQGDYSNAVLVLNRALQEQPDNIEISKDLAFAYYMQKNYSKALEIIKPVIEDKDGDVQSYQIAGMIYKAREEGNETEKLYRRGIKKYPKSGALYNEYGELLWYRQDNSAISQWEKGMEVDPNYSGNYYNAAKYLSLIHI